MTAIEVIGLLAGSTALSKLIEKLFDLIQQRRNRKAQKEDRAEARADARSGRDEEVLDKLSTIDSKLDKHIESDSRNWADNARTQILRFGDEIKQGVKHTEEHFNQILERIDTYDTYCDTHPDYPNTKAVATINLIKRVYEERLEKNDFQ